MARKEELQQMKARDLMRMATTLGIKGSWDMKKSEVVEAILGAESAENSDIGAKGMAEVGKEIANGCCDGMQSARDEVKTDDHNTNVEVECKGENESASVDMSQKMPYIEGAEIGTLVAFRLPNGKVKSAKIVKKSTKGRRFKLETDYGAQYIVSFDDIVWVRTGKRWPRGVYKLLKGMVEDGQSTNQ